MSFIKKEDTKSPLVEVTPENTLIKVKRFSYRRNGFDYTFEGALLNLYNDKLNYVYIETPFNVLKISTIDYPTNSVKLGRFQVSSGHVVDEIRDDVDLIASDDSGSGTSNLGDRFVFSSDNKNLTINKWIDINGNLPSNLQGYYIWQSGKIKSVFVKTNNNVNANFYVYKNYASTSAKKPGIGVIPIVTANLINENYKYIPLDLDIFAGDFFKLYVEITSGKVDYPTFTIEINY